MPGLHPANFRELRTVCYVTVIDSNSMIMLKSLHGPLACSPRFLWLLYVIFIFFDSSTRSLLDDGEERKKLLYALRFFVYFSYLSPPCLKGYFNCILHFL